MEVAERSELTPEKVVSDYRAYKLRKANNGREPSVSNRCSELGHPCTAYCYFSRTVPTSQRPSIDEGLAEIFDEGKKQERAIQADLLEMGYDIAKQQGSLRWESYNITGHRDFAISKDGSPFVRCEFKSVNPYTYEQLKTPEDVRNSKTLFVRKWYGQVVLYMLLDNQKEYWLFLKNKSRGSIKPIVFTWNDQMWQDAEALTKKAELVNTLVQIGELPTQELKIDDPEECSRCQFLTVCLPEMTMGIGARVLGEEEALDLAAKTARVLELRPLAKEYNDLDEEVKDTVKQIAAGEATQVVFGDYVASIKRSERKAFSVAASTQERVTFTFVGKEAPKKDTDLTGKLEQSIKEAHARPSRK